MKTTELYALTELILNEYKNKLLTPRMFRIELGMTKQDISNLKTRKPAQWDHIKKIEDMLLAKIEIHMLNNLEEKESAVPYIFILRAYDKEQYLPELMIKKDIVENNPPIVIEAKNTSNIELEILKDDK